MKPDKMPYIIYADLESLIKKTDGCATLHKNLQQQNQVNVFLADIQCQKFGHLITQKTSILHIVGKIEIKIFCSSLRERTTNMLNFEKKNMLPLTKKT